MEAGKEAIRAAAEEIGIVFAANFSVGVNLGAEPAAAGSQSDG